MELKSRNLHRLLNPETIAVVGGSVAAEVVRQCRKIGFAGAIWPVNPGRAQVEGVSCFPDVDALPAAPDATFIAVPREETVSVLAALARRGSGGAVCYASGFAEVGGAGVALQEELVSVARDMAIVGPNCYGLLNYLDGCALWPDRQGGKRVERGVAILTQSGNIGLNITMQRRNLPIAYMIAVGNKAVTDFHEYVDALLDDTRISAIGLHIEGLTHIHEFSVVAKKALERGIPIVALKAGASAIGARLTASHTSSLAGPDALFDALFERLGIARVADLAEFVETLKLLHVCGPLAGNRIVSMSCSGGDASLVADLAQVNGISLPELNAAAETALRETLGPLVSIGNPLDYQTYIWGDEPALTACFSGMMVSPSDIALLVLDFPHADAHEVQFEGWDESIRSFIAAHDACNKPAMVVSSLPELLPEHIAAQLLQAGVAPMQGLREALGAIRASAAIGARRALADQVQPVTGRGAPIPGEMVLLDEVAAKRALAAHGLPVPDGRLVRNADEAVDAAESIGYPIVLKAVSAHLTHKTEAGAVRLNLSNATEVREAMASLRAHADQFLVERMMKGGLAELIVGVTRDDQFGLCITIGAGGILVELLNDTVTLLLPVTRGDILQGLRQLRCFRLLDGYRGAPKADLDAIVSAVEAIVRYAGAEEARLQELDVNPLIALPVGTVAVDALIRLSAS